METQVYGALKPLQHGATLLHSWYPVIDSQRLSHEGYQDLLVNV